MAKYCKIKDPKGHLINSINVQIYLNPTFNTIYNSILERLDKEGNSPFITDSENDITYLESEIFDAYKNLLEDKKEFDNVKSLLDNLILENISAKDVKSLEKNIISTMMDSRLDDITSIFKNLPNIDDVDKNGVPRNYNSVVRNFISSYYSIVNKITFFALKNARITKDIKTVDAITNIIFSNNTQATDIRDMLVREYNIVQKAIEMFLNGNIDMDTLHSMAIPNRLELLFLLLKPEIAIYKYPTGDTYNKDIIVNGIKTLMLSEATQNERESRGLARHQLKLTIKEDISVLNTKYINGVLNFIKDLVVNKSTISDDEFLKDEISRQFPDLALKETSYFQLFFTGFGTDNNILLQSFDIYKEKISLVEKASTLKIFDNLIDAWKAIKDKVESGVPIYKKLLQEKEIGGKLRKILRLKGIFIESESVLKALKIYYTYLKQRHNPNSKSAYKNFAVVKSLLDNAKISFLDYRRIPEIRDILKKYIKDKSVLNEMLSKVNVDSDYVDNIKRLYGETGYKFLLNRVEKFIEEYSEIIENSNDDTHRNLYDPFLFLEKFFEGEDLGEMNSYYTFFIGVDEETVDIDFWKELEKDDGLFAFYNNAYTMLKDYINPVYRSEGMDIHDLDLIPNQTTKLFSLIKILGGSKGMSTWIKAMFNKYVVNNLTEYEDLAGDKSPDFFRTGLNEFPINDVVAKLQNNYDKEADAVFESIDDNIFKAILDSKNITENLKLRRRLFNVANIYKHVFNLFESDMSKLDKSRNKFNKLVDINIRGIKRTHVNQLKFIHEAKLVDNIESLDNPLKVLLHDIISKAIDDAEENGKTDLSFGNHLYHYEIIVENGKYKLYKVVDIGSATKQLLFSSKDKNQFKTDLKNILFGLKTPPRAVNISSVITAFMSYFITKILAFNFLTGFNNVVFEYLTIKASGVSNRFGYSDADAKMARRYLFGTIALRRLSSTFKSLREIEKYQNVETLIRFGDALGLWKNRADEIGKLAEKGYSVSSLKMRMFDLSINDSEFKSQGTIMLALMYNTFIEYEEDGEVKKRRIFDGHNFIWKPGTLKLKDKYRTPENIKNWEDFKVEVNEKSPVFNLFTQISAAIKGNIGNYEGLNMPAIFGNAIGSLAMIFQRWLPELIHLNWGEENINLRAGKKMEGKKQALIKKYPVLMSYITTKIGIDAAALYFLTSIISTTELGMFLYTFPTVVTAFLGVIGAKIVIQSTFTSKSKNFKDKIKSLIRARNMKQLKDTLNDLKADLKDVNLLLHFHTSSALRALDTMLDMLTYNQVSLSKITMKVENDMIDRFSENAEDKQTLKILLENSQDLANAVVSRMYGILTVLTTYFLVNLIFSEDCEDENNIDCIKKLRYAESLAKEYSTRIWMLQQEIDRQDNLFNLISSVSSGNTSKKVLMGIYNSMMVMGKLSKEIIKMDLELSDFKTIPEADLDPTPNIVKKVWRQWDSYQKSFNSKKDVLSQFENPIFRDYKMPKGWDGIFWEKTLKKMYPDFVTEPAEYKIIKDQFKKKLNDIAKNELNLDKDDAKKFTIFANKILAEERKKENKPGSTYKDEYADIRFKAITLAAIAESQSRYADALDKYKNVRKELKTINKNKELSTGNKQLKEDLFKKYKYYLNKLYKNPDEYQDLYNDIIDK